MPEYPRTHKSLEYAYPTSQNATDCGFGKTGCYLVSTYEYHAPGGGYARTIKQAFANRGDAVLYWLSLDLPINVWSCQSTRHPEWFATNVA
jgi:hypothetical protein